MKVGKSTHFAESVGTRGENTVEVAQSSPHRLGIFLYLLTMAFSENLPNGSFLNSDNSAAVWSR